MASYVPSDTYRTHLREVISPEPNPKKKCRRGRTQVSLVNHRDRTPFCCSWLPHFVASLKCLPQWIFVVSPEPSQNSKFQETDGISVSGWHQMCTTCTVPWQVPGEWTRKDVHQSQRKPCIWKMKVWFSVPSLNGVCVLTKNTETTSLKERMELCTWAL